MSTSSFVPSLIGGALIGLAVLTLLLVNGRVAGISGILGGLVQPEPKEWGWRAAFVIGLLGGGAVALLVHPSPGFGVSEASLPVLAVAGVLVGFGTRLAGGCTSGHGVCGISRFSLRSLVATGAFMLVAAAAVFLVRLGGRS
jgi:uncharacterized membrane protein YedE/YeeE